MLRNDNASCRHPAPATTHGVPWLYQQPLSRRFNPKTASPSPSLAATIIPWLASRTTHKSILWTLDTSRPLTQPPSTPTKAVSQSSTQDLQYLVCFYQNASRVESTWVYIDGTARRYTEFTDERSLPAFPVTAIPLAMFMVNYCHVHGHTSRSLSGIQSCLKTYNTQNGHAWLTTDHERIIREVRKGLANHDHSVPLRKLPITYAIINKLHTLMDLRRPDDHQLLVMSLMAHNGLLRENELCLINREDVKRTATGFSVYIRKSKSNKQGHREEVFYPHFEGSAASVIDLHLTQTQHINHKALFVNNQTTRRMTKAVFSTAIVAPTRPTRFAPAASRTCSTPTARLFTSKCTAGGNRTRSTSYAENEDLNVDFWWSFFVYVEFWWSKMTLLSSVILGPTLTLPKS